MNILGATRRAQHDAHVMACGGMCAQVAIRNNQQGVLYFSSNFKPEVLAAPAQSTAPLDDFFVSIPSPFPVNRVFHPKVMA